METNDQFCERIQREQQRRCSKRRPDRRPTSSDPVRPLLSNADVPTVAQAPRAALALLRLSDCSLSRKRHCRDEIRRYHDEMRFVRGSAPP
jgi:hypothetical protein